MLLPNGEQRRSSRPSATEASRARHDRDAANLPAPFPQLVAPLLNSAQLFLGSSLTFTLVYIWSQSNVHVNMSFLGLVTFRWRLDWWARRDTRACAATHAAASLHHRAPFLPWVLLGLGLAFGNDPTSDLLGRTRKKEDAPALESLSCRRSLLANRCHCALCLQASLPATFTTSWSTCTPNPGGKGGLTARASSSRRACCTCAMSENKRWEACNPHTP